MRSRSSPRAPAMPPPASASTQSASPARCETNRRRGDTPLMPAPRSVLVTGASGYVGGRLLAALRERGHAVRALSRSGDVDRTETVKGDVVSGDGLDEALDGVDV